MNNITPQQALEAVEHLLFLHSCEQEGLDAGKPTPEQWLAAEHAAAQAVPVLRDALSRPAAMTVGEAAALLRKHNKWRRGEIENDEMVDSLQLGEAIDLLCDQFRDAAKMMGGSNTEAHS